MSNESILGIVVATPFLLLLFIFIAINSSAKKIRIQDLREKVKSLPLDEEALNKRLDVFDEICAKVENEEVKMRLLEKLVEEKEDITEFKKVLAEQKKEQNDWYFKEYRKKDDEDFWLDMEQGILPSSITHHTSTYEISRGMSD